MKYFCTLAVFIVGLMSPAKGNTTPLHLAGFVGGGACQGECGGMNPGLGLRLEGGALFSKNVVLGVNVQQQWLSSDDLEGVALFSGGGHVGAVFTVYDRIVVGGTVGAGYVRSTFSVPLAGGGQDEVTDSGLFGEAAVVAGYAVHAKLSLRMRAGYTFHSWGKRNDNNYNAIFVQVGLSWSFGE